MSGMYISKGIHPKHEVKYTMYRFYSVLLKAIEQAIFKSHGNGKERKNVFI